MRKKYDLIVVGAGPAGAMAAKTAAEIGLNTLLLERKKDPSKLTRGCASMFAIESDYYFGERMYYNDKNKKMVFPVNGFTVDYDGPRRNYYAWHFYAPNGKTCLKFGNYEKSFKEGDAGRLSFVFNKGYLISSLLTKAEKFGAKILTGKYVEKVGKGKKYVKVQSGKDFFEGTFLIGADGMNSIIAEQMGFNKERLFFGRNSGITYYLTGTAIPQSEAIISGHAFKSNSSFHSFFWIIPSPYEKDEFWFAVKTPQEFDFITKESVYKRWFPNLRIRRRVGFVTNMRSPVSEPFKDNVLLAGDSAWFWEAEITGSMMCGWKAANSIAEAFRNNKLNRDGIISYINWWKKSYADFDDYRNMFLLIPFCNIFTEEELNYLFGLFRKPLRRTNNPFLIVRLVKNALKPLIPKIQKEMPSIIKKMDMLEVENIQKFTGIKQFFKKRKS
ncbi:MAG: FAD-binding protein [Candidatus Schekmanbacteria bacterium]|nr:MAG: FAD-binding protein [Candidatus Schekmanbacteria bacterium]